MPTPSVSRRPRRRCSPAWRGAGRRASRGSRNWWGGAPGETARAASLALFPPPFGVGARAGAGTPRPGEARYEVGFESISHGFYDWDIANNTIYYSPSLRAIWGMPGDQVLTPEESTQRVHPDDLPHYRQVLVQHLKGVTPR